MPLIHVFCAESDRFNLSHAKEHGEVVYHSDIPNPFDTENFCKYVEGLGISAGDFIAITGPLLNVALGVLVASLCLEDEVQLLLFDAKTDTYAVRRI